MLLTDDESLYNRCLVLRDHGRPIGDTMFVNCEVGFKYKMSALQAALGLAQLERIEELITRKRDIFSWYRNELADVCGITLNDEAVSVRNTYWMVTAIMDPSLGWNKESLIPVLKEAGFDSRPFFYPLSGLPAYAQTPQAVAARERNHIAYQLSPFGINLPSALTLDRETVCHVATRLRQVLSQPSRS